MGKKSPFLAELAHTHDVDLEDMIERLSDLLEDEDDPHNEREFLHITRAEAEFIIALLRRGGR